MSTMLNAPLNAGAEPTGLLWLVHVAEQAMPHLLLAPIVLPLFTAALMLLLPEERTRIKLAMNLLSTLLGLLLGSLLALALMGQLTQALADLYGPNPIDLLRLSPTSLIKALLIGLAGTLAANLPGWWQLLRQSPLELREGSSRPPVYPWRRRLLAIAILLLCALCLLLPQTGLGGALFVAGGWLLAMALALPDALRALLGRLRGHGPLSVRLGVAETQYHLDRTAIAVMALQLAIAAAIGIGVMVSSFRSSVEIWLGQRLAADLYVSAPKGVAGSRGQLSEQTLTAMAVGAPSWRWGDDLDAYIDRLMTIPFRFGGYTVFSAHQMGTCRMGKDRQTSVANPYGELHDVPGVWIGDASAFPTSTGTNPMLSTMALAHRTAEAVIAAAGRRA